MGIRTLQQELRTARADARTASEQRDRQAAELARLTARLDAMTATALYWRMAAEALADRPEQAAMPVLRMVHGGKQQGAAS